MGANHSHFQCNEEKIDRTKTIMKAASIALSPIFAGTKYLIDKIHGNFDFEWDRGHYPMENLSYNDALKFVRQLSKMTNKKFDLPTEEEWEYAARGGQKSLHYRYAGSNRIDDVAWYRHNSDLMTHPVGEKQPNELGIYDMSGNVWEWTKSKAHQYDTDISPEDKMYIRRGGSVFHVKKNCRVSFRYEKKRVERSPGSGLRVVLREDIDEKNR